MRKAFSFFGVLNVRWVDHSSSSLLGINNNALDGRGPDLYWF